MIDIIRDEVKLEEKAAKLEVKEVPGATDQASRKLGVITLPDFYADLKGKRDGDALPRSFCGLSRTPGQFEGQRQLLEAEHRSHRVESIAARGSVSGETLDPAGAIDGCPDAVEASVDIAIHEQAPAEDALGERSLSQHVNVTSELGRLVRDLAGFGDPIGGQERFLGT